jgi:hypothetical protein
VGHGNLIGCQVAGGDVVSSTLPLERAAPPVPKPAGHFLVKTDTNRKPVRLCGEATLWRSWLHRASVGCCPLAPADAYYFEDRGCRLAVRPADPAGVRARRLPSRFRQSARSGAARPCW